MNITFLGLLNDYSSPGAYAYSVFEIFNYVILAICTLGFVFQILFFLLSFLRNKSLPSYPDKKRFCVVIPAHNEEEVIGLTIKKLYETVDYPKELIKVVVCCHNCSDNTYDKVVEAGGIAFNLTTTDPKESHIATPIRAAVQYVMDNMKDSVDCVTKIDADNVPHANFFNVMSDAMNHGYDIVRGYIASSNLTLNNWTKCSGLYYMRDSRVCSQVREALHLSSFLDGGCGMTFSMKVLEDIGGYLATNASDDIDMTIQCLYKKKRIHYCKDAIMYNDQPSTFKDTFNRNTRIGNGLIRLFFKESPKMLALGIFTGKPSLIDMFLQLIFIPTSFLSLGWILPYYLGLICFHMINMFIGGGIINNTPGLGYEWMTPDMSFAIFKEIVISGCIFLLVFGLMYIIQTIICSADAKKTLNVPMKKMTSGILLSPIFMLIYNLAIFVGILSKPRWKKINRSLNYETMNMSESKGSDEVSSQSSTSEEVEDQKDVVTTSEPTTSEITEEEVTNIEPSKDE